MEANLRGLAEEVVLPPQVAEVAVLPLQVAVVAVLPLQVAVELPLLVEAVLTLTPKQMQLLQLKRLPMQLPLLKLRLTQLPLLMLLVLQTVPVVQALPEAPRCQVEVLVEVVQPFLLHRAELQAVEPVLQLYRALALAHPMFKSARSISMCAKTTPAQWRQSSLSFQWSL